MQLKVVNLAKTYQFVADALTFDFTYKIANPGGWKNRKNLGGKPSGGWVAITQEGVKVRMTL